MSFWKNKRVFITGATGFVGSWLVKYLLEEGAYVVALVRDMDPQSELYRSGDYRRISVINGRLEDFSTLERAINEHEIDTVFHLAAQPIVGVAHRYPLHTFEANIRGTYHLLEACRIHSQFVQRVVVASSDKAYGTQPKLPYTEDMPLQGRFPYEVSKSCTDLIAQTYYHTYELPVAIARCGNIYGGGDLNWSRIVPGTIRSLLQGERPIIRSDGTYVRDYIYVKDVVYAFMFLAEKLDDPALWGEAFNFSPERAVTVLELVSLLQRLMHCEYLEPDIRNEAEGEIHSQYLDSSKAQRLLGWSPQYTLETGLIETVEWYRGFLAE
ncbi:MAG: NAD-dependent epimerase/dehydratase family protein [Methanobacteriota archaeon]|nr:MAG: NAD-dependent epimerase/dehydratase family protein [Euryarchaeota archaeon]